jgi:hypothetical protein
MVLIVASLLLIAPALNNGDQGSEQQKIVQDLLERHELQAYLSGIAVEGLNLSDKCLAPDLSVTRHGRPVPVVPARQVRTSGQPYIEFEELTIGKRTTKALFRYMPRRLTIFARLRKSEHNWIIYRYEVIETRSTS